MSESSLRSRPARCRMESTSLRSRLLNRLLPPPQSTARIHPTRAAGGPRGRPAEPAPAASFHGPGGAGGLVTGRGRPGARPGALPASDAGRDRPGRPGEWAHRLPRSGAVAAGRGDGCARARSGHRVAGLCGPRTGGPGRAGLSRDAGPGRLLGGRRDAVDRAACRARGTRSVSVARDVLGKGCDHRHAGRRPSGGGEALSLSLTLSLFCVPEERGRDMTLFSHLLSPTSFLSLCSPGAALQKKGGEGCEGTWQTPPPPPRGRPG